jgi:small-conductance mechanosensitive channel
MTHFLSILLELIPLQAGEQPLDLVGPQKAVEIFGLRLVGLSAENGKKLLVTIIFILLIGLLKALLHFIAKRISARRPNKWRTFWMHQAIQISTSVLLFIGIVSVWFDDPSRLATALGLVTAGLAFALQKVVTALAGYIIILRGKVFEVGNRIVMGGVRGDVVELSFMQTTIMEMGQPQSVQNADPAMWVRGRQYTGRLVTVSNAKIFDEPVYNYTREFPYIWEEISIPIPYRADRKLAEKILIEAAAHQTLNIDKLTHEILQEIEHRYFLKPSDIQPRVYLSITDNWLELNVRFLVEGWGIREIKDAVSREILQKFDEAGIEIASATTEITKLPELPVTVNKK